MPLIPAELRSLPQWVCWRHEERSGKPTKVPLNASTGRLASSTDPRTWTTYDAAYGSTNGDGIGFVVTADDPYLGIDLDHCVTLDGTLSPFAAKLVERFASYSEITPSHEGVRVWVRAVLPGGKGRKKRVSGGPKGMAIELYDRARYFTVTGYHLPSTPATIEDRQAQIDALLAELWAPHFERSSPVDARPLDLSDAELIDRARSARNGARFERLWNGDTSGHGGDDSAADLALCCDLAYWTRRDAAWMDSLFRKSGLMREKWNRADYRQRTIAAAIEFTPECYTPRTVRAINSKPIVAPPLVTSLGVYSAATLKEMKFSPRKWAIPGLIVEGCTILAARPKIGKSWMALDLALTVALGGTALGSIPEVEAGEVLYAALEDVPQRMQARIKMLGTSWPGTLYLVHDLPRLDNGCLESLDAWLDEHPSARLIVIDTLTRIRPPRSRNADVYLEDSILIARIQGLAQRRGVAIVVVYHTRKAPALDDPFDAVSGSLGLTGSADAALVLIRQRGHADATMHTTGRDIDEKALALNFDSVTCKWTLKGQADANKTSQERRAIFDLLKNADVPMTPTEIAKELGKKPGATRKLLSAMSTAKEINRPQTGKYESIGNAVTPCQDSVGSGSEGVTGNSNAIDRTGNSVTQGKNGWVGPAAVGVTVLPGCSRAVTAGDGLDRGTEAERYRVTDGSLLGARRGDRS